MGRNEGGTVMPSRAEILKNAIECLELAWYKNDDDLDDITHDFKLMLEEWLDDNIKE